MYAYAGDVCYYMPKDLLNVLAPKGSDQSGLIYKNERKDGLIVISVRRKDREIDCEAALEVVDRCEYAVIAMTEPSGTPYCVPVSIVREGESVYFHSAQEGFKLDCLRSNPQVCVCCVGDTCRAENAFTTAYESAVLRGIAQPVEGNERKIHVLRLLCLRHTPANMGQFEAAIKSSLAHTAVWEIKIESITGKRRK